MVLKNNSFRGIHYPEMDAYLRNLNDFRAGVDVSLLPIIGHFVANSEGQEEEGSKILIPSGIIESERGYLQYLKDQYYKRDFEFVVDPENPIRAYDTLTKLIRRSRQAVSYSLLDVYDFMAEQPGVFMGVKLPPNVAITIDENGTHYNHDKINPEYLEGIIDTCPNIDPHFIPDGAQPQIKKYQFPFQLYFSVLGDVKRIIDFELLKMYDYLVEHGEEDLHSTKLVEVFDNVSALGEREYYKQRIGTRVKPFGPDQELTQQDLVLDEWASNLRRIVDLKEALTGDLIEYLNNAPKEERLIYRTGAYPELFSLIDARYKGNTPSDLERLTREEMKELIS